MNTVRVAMVCGACGFTDPISLGDLRDVDIFGPRCICGRFDWRYPDGRPVPFRIPEVEDAVRSALAVMALGWPGIRLTASDWFEIRGKGRSAAFAASSLPHGMAHPIRLKHRRVFIDGQRFDVRDVEWWGDWRARGFALIVREVAR